MHPDILRHKAKIDSLFKEVRKIDDMRMQGEWARYLCVLASGYLENAIRIILTEYISKNSSTKIQKFNEPLIEALTNCKHAKIVKILEQFHIAWAETFVLEVEAKDKIKNEIKDAIDSLVQNRHNIAHGRNVGIGFVSVEKYFEKTQIAVEIINKIIT